MEKIKISEHNGEQAVSARELHAFLESKQDFSNWISNRIKKYGFVENQDYTVFNKFIENSNGGRPLTEYALTIECAKELAMVEGNAKGKEARQYFIQCEKAALEIHKRILSPKELALLVIDAENKREEAEKQLAETKDVLKLQAPKVLFADAVSTSKTSVLVGELAKILKQNGLDIGQNRLFNELRDRGFLIKRHGTDFNMPTQRSMELELFEIKETSISHSDGHVSISKTPKVTGKGQVYFIEYFLKKAA